MNDTLKTTEGEAYIFADNFRLFSHSQFQNLQMYPWTKPVSFSKNKSVWIEFEKLYLYNSNGAPPTNSWFHNVGGPTLVHLNILLDP